MPIRSSWRNFTRDEFACRCGCGTNKVQDRLIDVLQGIRKIVKAPIIITSGYRCLDHPREVVKPAGPGVHTKGIAADIVCRDNFALKILRAAMGEPLIKGVGISQKGDKRFIHLDMGRNAPPHRPRPHIWTY